MPQAELLVDCRNQLGKCVRWNEAEQRVYWTDALAQTLHSCDAQGRARQQLALPEPLHAFAFDPAGDLLGAFSSGLHRVRLEPLLCERLAPFEEDLPRTHPNDGRCDPMGRFVIGGRHDGFYDPVSSVMSYSGGTDGRTLFGDVAHGSGIAFSASGQRLYFTDCESLALHVFEYDPWMGRAHTPRLFALIPRRQGFADGACVAADDSLWSARHYGGCVQQYLPDGREGTRLVVPTRCVTGVCFGGARLDQLFITTASSPLPAREQATDPLAGCLFVASVSTPGSVEHRFVSPLFP